MGGACSARSRTAVSTVHHTRRFEYDFGSLSVQKWPRNSFASVVVYVAGEVSSAGEENAACFGLLGHRESLNKSGILQLVAEPGVCAALLVDKGVTLEYYYGLLVIEKLSSFGLHFKTYEEGIMKLIGKMFLKPGGRLPKNDNERNMVRHSVRLVPAPFCAMRLFYRFETRSTVGSYF